MVVDQPVDDDRDALVAERDDVRGGVARAAAVVDADEEAGRIARLVDDHHGHAAVERRAHGRVPVGHAVQAERVHDGVAHAADLLLLAAHAGEQQQLVAAGLGRLGQPLQEADGAGIGERVGQALGEHQADGPTEPRPQPPRGRVGPGVAEPLGGLEHLPPQLGGELVRPVVGVRDRRARDAQGVGDRLQRHPLCHRDRSTGSGDTRSASAIRLTARRRRVAAAGARSGAAGTTGAPGSAERAWDAEARRARCAWIGSIGERSFRTLGRDWGASRGSGS